MYRRGGPLTESPGVRGTLVGIYQLSALSSLRSRMIIRCRPRGKSRMYMLVD